MEILLSIVCTLLFFMAGFLGFKFLSTQHELKALKRVNEDTQHELNSSRSAHEDTQSELKASKHTNEELQNTVKEYSHALEEGQRAIDLALKYEEFYSSTVGDVGQIVDALGAVISKRQVLSDDPDVQNLVRLLAIAHDTLLGYINAKSPAEQHRDNELASKAVEQ